MQFYSQHHCHSRCMQIYFTSYDLNVKEVFLYIGFELLNFDIYKSSNGQKTFSQGFKFLQATILLKSWSTSMQS